MKLTRHEKYRWYQTLKNPQNVIIDSQVYSLGDTNDNSNRPFKGMGGRKFDIELLSMQEKVTTYDLWYLGTVPEELIPDFPDNAKFLNGAGMRKVGGSISWRASE